jgi:hypothetical protein
MMDQAFEGDGTYGRGNWHALLVNLKSCRDEDWRWLPIDGHRTIFELVKDLGGCKYVYASHLAGDRSIHWDRWETIPPLNADATPAKAIAYLRDAQIYLRSRVDALADDGELLKIRLTPQGFEREARWLIKTMIEHDLYHTGEINHLRALAQKNDDGNEDD